jgi:signal transduction histidine kinase
MKMRSLTRILISGVLLAGLLCAVCFSGVAVFHEMQGRKHAFDIMLRGRADSLLGSIRGNSDSEDNVTVNPSELALPKGDVYLVTLPSGKVLGQSQGLSPKILEALSSHTTDGYYTFEAEGRHYRALKLESNRTIYKEEKSNLQQQVVLLYGASTAHLWHEVEEAVQFYVVACVLLLLLTGFAIAWFLRRWLSPLRELAARAEEVSADSWDFIPPDAALHTRELEPIASSIQKLLTGLRQSFDRQRQFSGDAAHELKTSVAVFKSSLQLLLMRERTIREYVNSIGELLVDTQRMENLTNRMLALARIEETPVNANEIADLSSVLQATVNRLRAIAQLKLVRFEEHKDLSAHTAMPTDDAEALCSNLLLNAVQHSRRDSVVHASVKAQQGTIELIVSDAGEGIPEEALPYVFERFYRADPSRSRANGGAGLGLAICKAIVDRCGGAITISSVPGAGTEVKVVLPIAPLVPHKSRE